VSIGLVISFVGLGDKGIAEKYLYFVNLIIKSMEYFKCWFVYCVQGLKHSSWSWLDQHF